jgi:rare lipoprotein A
MECRFSGFATPLALISALLCAPLLAGCQGTLGLEPALAAATPAEDDAADDESAEGQRHIGKPYQVGGRWYHPKEDEDYDETGVASWYGSEFHGSRTANGERFDPSMLTGAHPTLPLPSFVRVTNLKNGKTAVVRLNDRGPFKPGRIVDVSRAVAEKLDFRRAGSAKVRVEYLGPAPIDGGDEETLVAEAKFETGGGSDGSKGLGRFIPSFGFGGSDEEEPEGGEVEVRLASAEPPRRGDPLPGVSAPTAVVPPVEPAAQPSAVASAAAEPVQTASAYQAAGEDDIDALLAMNAEPSGDEAAPAEATAPAPEPAPATTTARAAAPASSEPLRAVPAEEAESRILGAHDLFAAIDSSSGGSGELNGVKPAE